MKKISELFLSENVFLVFGGKLSIYLNRRVFAMINLQRSSESTTGPVRDVFLLLVPATCTYTCAVFSLSCFKVHV